MLRKSIALLLVALVAVAFAFGEGQKEKQQRTLHIYTAFDTQEAEHYIQAFEEDTGIDVQYVRMSSGEVLARVESEADNPQASVWHAGSNTSHIAAASQGLLEPYEPDIDYELPDQFHAEDWAWIGFYTGAIGFATNTEYLEENNVEAPTSWDDLLSDAFADNVGLAYPYTSGTAYTTWATRVQMLGLEDALDWWEEFDQNSVHHYTNSGTGSLPQAGLGEIAVSIAFSHDILSGGIGEGYPLTMTFPEEGTGFEIGGLSLIAGGPEPELGQQFIDWSLSTPAQNLFQEYYRIPVNPNAQVAEDAVTMDQLDLIDFDHIWAGENKDRLVEAWRERMGQ